jgi:hypothetical protein
MTWLRQAPHIIAMRSNHKTGFHWLHILGTIGIAFSLILCAAIIWYLTRIEVPSTARVQSDVLTDKTDLTTFMKTVSSTPPHIKSNP